MDNSNNGDTRQMYDNNGQGWECVDCGGNIEKLPFEPRDGSNLRCFDCHKKASSAPRREERQMYDNNGQGWQCAECGGKIDKLPFDPRDTSNLKCLDCFRK